MLVFIDGSGDKRSIDNLRFDETGKDWELYRNILKKMEENV